MDGAFRSFQYNISLMCSEKEAFDCHRFGLISEFLSKNAINVKHIYPDKVVSQQELEKQLLKKYDKKLQALLDKLEIHDEFKLYRKLVDLAWIDRDYGFIYNLLWRQEKRDELEYANYEKLIFLEKSLKGEAKLEYLYKRAWKKTNKIAFVYTLFYFYMENREFDKLESFRDSLSSKVRKNLEKGF